ncbi:MAG: cytochrome c3 family protein [Gemmatimonadota bacterium]
MPVVALLFAGLFHLGAPAALAQTREDCLTCHSDSTLTKEVAGRKPISLFADEAVLNKSTHAKLACVACHTGFNPDDLPHKATIEPVACQRCHSGAVFKHQFHRGVSRVVGRELKPGALCKDCHGTHNVESPKRPGAKFSAGRLTESCGSCHTRAAAHFPASAHGQALAAGVKGAPNCLTCHRGALAFVAGAADSLSVKRAQEQLCLSCHRDDPDVRARTSPTAGFIAAYDQSVHGAELLKGNAKAANCVSCHGSHDMKKGSSPGSFVNRANIPSTCAKCHAEVAKTYGQSVHGAAVLKGNSDSPVCTTCHGEHTILARSDPRSRTAAKNVSAQVCSPCHTSVLLSAKYGIKSDRFRTFTDSYHGLAIRGGSVEVANCASCHSGHDIKPASDPTSSVNKANLIVTCGRCHPKANERFAVGSVHITLTEQQEPLLYWVATAYILMIVVIVGGMFVHNLLDFVKKSKRKLMVRRGLIEEEHVGHALYLRMSLNERLQHGTLVVSFLTLVITGFALKFPEAWWVAPLQRVSPSVFAIRSAVHRIAGVVMVLASLYHCYYLFFVPRGRQLLRDLLPKPQDIRDVFMVMRYNLGWSTARPRFERFSYIEKSEYWALVWGTILMGGTGVILWFDNTFIGLLTKLGWDVARTVHYYEAWLATLAIIVWHMYFVIFNPDTYPINLAFWKGTLTEREMLEEHPLELERLKAGAAARDDDDDDDDDDPDDRSV